MFTIYAHRNIVNNKYYIGQTSKKVYLYRFGYNGSGYRSQTKFYKAIKKYGWDNFEHFILETNLMTQEEADIAEVFYINKYNSCVNGYNVESGGKIGKINELLCRKVFKYSLDGEFISEYSSLTEAAIDNNVAVGSICKCCKKQLKSCGNFIWSYDKLADKPILNRLKNNKIVYQYDKKGNLLNIFESGKDAAEKTGINKSHICNCCKYKRKSAGGYVWRFAEDDFYYQETECPTKRKVMQLSLDGQFIAEYSSLHEAARAIGNKSFGNIYMVCNNKRSSAYGFKWQYSDEK